jgi:hypothetical protein
MLGRNRHSLEPGDSGSRADSLDLIVAILRDAVISGRAPERHGISLAAAARLRREHAQGHEIACGAVLEFNESAALPIAERANDFSLRVVEPVGHVGNAGGPACIHHAKKIQIDLQLRVIGVFHILIDKKIRDQGGAPIVFAVYCEQFTDLPKNRQKDDVQSFSTRSAEQLTQVAIGMLGFRSDAIYLRGRPL